MMLLLKFLARLKDIDRRFIFLVLFIAVALPFLINFKLQAKPEKETIIFYDELTKAINSEKPIMVAVDFGPQTMAELLPVLQSVMHYIFLSGQKAIFLTMMPEAAAILRSELAIMEKLYELTYGEDYVFLGYAAAYEIAMYAMGTQISDYFHADDKNISIENIKLMKSVNNYDDVSAVFSIASNKFPKDWITYAVAPFGFKFLMACTAVNATDYYPYLQTGQVKGLIAGGKAGAEFESLLVEKKIMKKRGDATRGLGSQALAIFVIIAFVIMGNLGQMASKKLEGKN